MEKRRIGFPRDSDRIELIEDILINTLPDGPEKARLTAMLARMDKFDIDFPDPR